MISAGGTDTTGNPAPAQAATGGAAIAGGEEARGVMATLRDSLGRRRTRYIRLALVLSDLFALTFAFFGVERLFGFGPEDGLSTAGILFLASLPVWLVGFKHVGLYEIDDTLDQGTTTELSRIGQGVVVGTWLLLAGVWAVDRSSVELGHFVAFWAAATALMPAVRIVARAEYRRDRLYPQNTVIVGAGDVGQRLALKFLRRPDYNVNLLGFVDTAPKDAHPALGHIDVLGVPEDLPDLVDRYDVERVVIAFTRDPLGGTLDLIRSLHEHDVQIDIVPRLFDVLPPELARHNVEGIPLLTLPALRLSRTAAFVKRGMDIGLSALGLAVLAPFFALTALAIKLTSPGPVFFRQERMGYRERPFRIYKFRTMVADADARKHEVAALNEHARPGGDPRMFKVRHDPRVTAAGRFLRRYSLDELPQLVNVLKGEMSLIGPRPLIPEEQRFVTEKWARRRLAIKPGITGLWQVMGRHRIPFEEMIRLDYLYVTTWSLVGDLRILLQTIPVLVRGEHGGDY